jgi:hypothetical protein
MRSSLPRLALLLLALAVTPPVRGAFAAPPATLNYEGNLMSADGRALSTGRYDVRFALYASATGGEPLWVETHAKVQVNGGLFQVVLGKGNPAAPLDLPFDQQYFLGIAVDGGPELTPRVELMPTPYSFHARRAEQVSDGSVTRDKLAAGAVTDDKIHSVSWHKITGVNGAAGVPSAIWSLKGNARTDAGADFIGTTDPSDLVFRTDNQLRFSIRSGGEGQFLSDFDANGRITSNPTGSSGAFLFGDRAVGLERTPGTADLRVFGPSSGAFVFDGGNVGIGAWSPSSKLEVNGRTTLRENLQVDGRADVTGGAGVGEALTVGGATTLEDLLRVSGATTLQGTLATAGAATLSSSLTVNGPTALRDETESAAAGSGALVVGGGVGIGKSLRVGKDFTVFGSSTFSGPMASLGGGSFGALEVGGNATIAGDASANKFTAGGGGLTSGGPSRLNGQVVVNANLDANGDATAREAYPLRVVGSSQGVIIEVNGAQPDGTPNKTNHFVSFVGQETNRFHGRISGLTASENEQEEQYKWEKASLIIQTALAGVDVVTAAADIVASIASATACVGLGACVTTPIPSLIVASIASGVTAAVGAGHAAGDLTAWYQLQARLTNGGGVTYSSASADYAEWLPKADPAEKIFPGDIVGVHHGRVSRRTIGADLLMVASTRPLVLGNTPPEGQEADYVKVAFMGQVPVKVFGRVKLGDYLVPSGNDNGYAVARAAEEVSAADLARVVGVAWEGTSSLGLGYVNTAVGLDRASVARVAERQESRLRAQASEIDELRTQLQRTNAALARLVPGFEAELPATRAAIAPAREPAPLPAVTTAAIEPVVQAAVLEPPMAEATFAPALAPADPPPAMTAGAPVVSRYDVELGIRQAVEQLRRTGATPENNPILRQLLSPNIVEEMRAKLQASLSAQLAPGR